MAFRTLRRLGLYWTKDDVSRLAVLVKRKTPARVIGSKLGRTENAVRAKASELGISLKPVFASKGSKKGEKKRGTGSGGPRRV